MITKDRRRPRNGPAYCKECGTRLKSRSTRERYTWYKCPACQETAKVQRPKEK